MMKKRNLKRITALFLAAVLSIFSVFTVFADDAIPPADYDEVIAIIHTNDVHGEIEVEPYVKGLADQMKASGEYSLVLTVSAGDVYSGGEPVAGYYKGELIPAIQDQVYDVIAPGNNDFNDGMEQNLLLTSLYNKTKTICANLFLKDELDIGAFIAGYQAKIGNQDFADLYSKVKLAEDGSLDLSGLGLSGIIPPGASLWSSNEIVTTSKGTKLGLFGLSCTGGQLASKIDTPGTIAAAQSEVEKLKAAGANAIVALAHTGWMGEGVTEPAQANDTNAWMLANEVQGMDAVVDSHTHLVINEGKGAYVGENRVFVNQAGSFGNCIGIMKIYLKDGKVVNKTGELISGVDIPAVITPDPAILAMVQTDLDRVYADVGPTLVTTPYYLNADSIPALSARGAETNMGDFITDVILNAASEYMGKDYAFTFYPGYCLRKSIEADTMMTKVDIAGIISFPTPLVEKEYTAQEILDKVTWNLQAVFPENFKASTFYQYSGLNVTYTNEGGVGTPVTIMVGDELIYDASKGGIQVPDSWKVLGVKALDPNVDKDGIDGEDPEKVICADVDAVRQLICDYLASHVLGRDFLIYPNELAPAGRIVEVKKDGIPLSDTDVQILASSVVYNGKPQTPPVKITYGNAVLIEDKDYQVYYSDNINAGAGRITIIGKGAYYGSVQDTFGIYKANNSITKVTKSKTLKASTLKKRSQAFQIAASVKDNAKKTFKKVSVTKAAKKYISVSSGGKVTVKKGLKKGKYTLKVKITAKATKNYKTATATKSVVIIVK